MGRPAASVVSALSSFVANGRQVLHHVSSPLSKIPYGGFSPVRLQTGLLPRPSPSGTAGWLIRGRSPLRPIHQAYPAVWAQVSASTNTPVQRSLARQRVMLSRQVLAYYDLIRGSGPLPPTFLAGIRRVFATRAEAQSVPAFLCVSFRPCRLPYPGRPDGADC